ncbi:head GIN domain-containing protein [uncultured Eudoraea sp.]|uniref:head GIN domain-containing protein n=1 Tax=uncultured Eudoraea sp. TaxID=1035614 RepID=UPI0026176661|nr:head GIN domain-containing protein [uncultured Eudoraea sp.]
MNVAVKSGIVIAFLFAGLPMLFAQSATIAVEPFSKVIISPHIEVNLMEGDRETVVLENVEVPREKINIEVVKGTLRIYLDDAKMYTKSKKVKGEDYSGRKDIYDGTMVTANITYKMLKKLSVRGEETIKCESPIDQNELELTIYGESEVYMDKLSLQHLSVAIYGESYLEVKSGTVNHQKYNAYGESEVNTLKMENSSTKITAYGESEFRVNVSDKLKVTCYGEADIEYQGNANVDKGVVIGEASIRKTG